MRPRFSRRSFLVWCALAGAPPLAAQDRPALDFEPNLPLVFVKTNGPLNIGQKVRGTVRVQYPAGSPLKGTAAMAAEVKFRGAVSLSYEKKSMAFELDSSAGLAGLAERRHWILNAAFIDRSLMRHKLAYDLFTAMSGPGKKRHAAGSRFVEVFMNDKYQGVYLLTERVDRRLLGMRPFKASDAAHACIYKVVDHAAVFDQDGHNGYEQHEPDTNTHPYWGPLDEINHFAKSSRDGAFFDPKDGIASRVDVDDAMDFHLHLLMIHNTDGPDKNFIVARDGAAHGAPPRFFFVPWDCDATFGRSWYGSREGATAWLSHHLFDRLLKDRAYRERFVARWRELRQKQFSSAALQKMIDENARTLGPAAQRNASRWKNQAGNYPDQLSFEQDVAQMKDWVTQRGVWLDRTIGEIAR